MFKKKKGQIPSQGMVILTIFIVITVCTSIFFTSSLITSKLNSQLNDQLTESHTITNETISTSSHAATLSHGPLSTETITAVSSLKNRSNDYTWLISTIGFNYTSTTGAIKVNATISDGAYNITYTYDLYTATLVAKDEILVTGNDSFSLGFTALLVLIAVALLSAIVGLALILRKR